MTGELVLALVLREFNPALADSDDIFKWIPWAIALGAGIGIFGSVALFRRARPAIVATVTVALCPVTFWSSSALILATPAFALLLVRVVEARRPRWRDRTDLEGT